MLGPVCARRAVPTDSPVHTLRPALRARAHRRADREPSAFLATGLWAADGITGPWANFPAAGVVTCIGNNRDGHPCMIVANRRHLKAVGVSSR